MYIILGILLCIVGVVMIANPRLFYDIVESWKNSGNAEPSDLYIFNTRLGGVVFFLVGIAGTVILLFF